MKIILLTMCLLMTQVTVAASIAANKKTLNAIQFKKEIELIDFHNGELSDLGGNCELTTEKGKYGDSVVISTDTGIKYSVLISKDAQVKVEYIGEDSDSMQTIYEFGASNKIVLIHADDAYDTVTLESSETKLTCGAYY